MKLPIDMDLVQKNIEIPKKIAELSYKDEKKAIHYLRIYGEKKLPISELYSKLSEEVS